MTYSRCAVIPVEKDFRIAFGVVFFYTCADSNMMDAFQNLAQFIRRYKKRRFFWTIHSIASRALPFNEPTSNVDHIDKANFRKKLPFPFIPHFIPTVFDAFCSDFKLTF